MTYDLRQVNELRDLLLANRIDCQVKVINSPMGAGRNRLVVSRRQEQHIVYVHKTDWEYAMYLLRKQ